MGLRADWLLLRTTGVLGFVTVCYAYFMELLHDSPVNRDFRIRYTLVEMFSLLLLLPRMDKIVDTADGAFSLNSKCIQLKRGHRASVVNPKYALWTLFSFHSVTTTH